MQFLFKEAAQLCSPSALAVIQIFVQVYSFLLHVLTVQTRAPIDGAKGERRNNAYMALSQVMAPQALCLAGLYVQPVVLSLQDMMAYISSQFPAVGDHLCFCLCSRLTFPLTPVFICSISLLQKSEIVVQSICLLQSQELHILQVFTLLWHVSLNLSPRRTSSHFQSNDSIWDVFLLNTTAHHAVLWWPSGV